MTPVVPAGLYRHYKGGMYRVLFTARSVFSRPLQPNEEAVVYVDNSRVILVGLKSDVEVRGGVLFLAKNSTDGELRLHTNMVVYVALYGDGRISVRDAEEFCAEVSKGVRRFAPMVLVVAADATSDLMVHGKPQPEPKNCHACKYSGMEPADMNLTCFHPDTGSSVGLHIWKEPLEHCPNYSKFEQHPGRNPNGSLKSI